MKTSLKTIKLSLTLIFALAFIILINQEKLLQTNFSTILDLKILHQITLFSISIATFLFLGFQLKATLYPYQIKTSLAQCTKICIANTLLNYLPAKAGIALKGLYLKRYYKLSYKDYGISLLSTSTIYLFTSAIIGLIASLPILTKNITTTDSESIYIFALILIITTLGIYTLFQILSHLSKGYFLKKDKVRAILKGLSVLKDKKYIFLVTLSSISLIAITSTRLYFSFSFLGENISLSSILFIQACLSASLIVSLTPGNLGIKEGLIVSLASVMGYSAETALLASLIDRLAALIPTIVLGPISILYLAKTP